MVDRPPWVAPAILLSGPLVLLALRCLRQHPGAPPPAPRPVRTLSDGAPPPVRALSDGVVSLRSLDKDAAASPTVPKGRSFTMDYGGDGDADLHRRPTLWQETAFHKIMERNGHRPFTFNDWQRFCEEVRVEFSEAELRRLFERYDSTGAGLLEPHDIRRALDRCIFLQSLCNRKFFDPPVFDIPADYDWGQDTNHGYAVEGGECYGDFRDIRESRDYGYHVQYTRDRQEWQDRIIKSTISRTVHQPWPWIVFTCGAMGAGKGHVMSWLSRQEIFPLESMVRIDPDIYKRYMPEWDGYVRRDRFSAGSMCHRESGFIQEIATEVALRTSQNVWVDGSLRDGDWFGRVFDDIRERFPEYRIAIFCVSASEDVVRARCAQRARETGRVVPEEVLVASLQAPAASLHKLMSKSDLVARINNDDTPLLSTCLLSSLATIDRSSLWGPIKSKFAKIMASDTEFPEAKAPFRLLRTNFDATHIRLKSHMPPHGRQGDLLPAARPLLGGALQKLLPETQPLLFSEVHSLTLDYEHRAQAGIPHTAQKYAFSYPLPLELREQGGLEDPDDPHVCFLLHGGYVYFDHTDALVTATALRACQTKRRADFMVQFGPKQPVPMGLLDPRDERWHPVTEAFLRDRGARLFTWVHAQEQFAGQAPWHGAFAYTLQGNRQEVVLFPVVGVNQNCQL